MTREHILQLTLGQVWSNGNINTLEQLNENLPVQLSLVSYMRLAQSSQFWDKKTLRSGDDNQTGTGIIQFFRGFKKGSKNIEIF
jgi:hypothetical protein